MLCAYKPCSCWHSLYASRRPLKPKIDQPCRASASPVRLDTTNPASTAYRAVTGPSLPSSASGSHARLGITDRASTAWRGRRGPSPRLRGRVHRVRAATTDLVSTACRTSDVDRRAHPGPSAATNSNRSHDDMERNLRRSDAHRHWGVFGPVAAETSF